MEIAMQREIGAEPERAISRGVLGDAPCAQAPYPAGDLVSHNRYRYSAITRRPDFVWPNRRRLAVYVALNLEHFAFGDGLGAELCPGGPQPDVLNYAWRDYGNRVGVWRLIDLFEELSLPASVLV